MPRTVVGLDIGTSGVRAAELTVGRRTPTLRKVASVPLPPGAVTSGRVTDPEAVTEALRELWSQGRFGTRNVVLGVANDGVLVRQMDLDWMPPADFRKALRFQVADSLPVPVDEANLDYYLLDELDLPVAATGRPDGPAAVAPGSARPADGAGVAETRRVARVMLVAAGRDMVDSFVAAVEAAGLRPVKVDLVPFALVRAAAPAKGGDGGVEAVVDVGADTVSVVVHRAGRPRFVRMIPGLGSDAITGALQERYQWAREDAERTKIVLGLPGAALPEGAEEFADHPAHQVIAAEAEGIVAEVRATVDYYRASAEDSTLSGVRLAGNGSRLPGLAELLQERLGVPVTRLSVADRVRGRRRRDLDDDADTLLAVPAGLCLGGTN